MKSTTQFPDGRFWPNAHLRKEQDALYKHWKHIAPAWTLSWASRCCATPAIRCHRVLCVDTQAVLPRDWKSAKVAPTIGSVTGCFPKGMNHFHQTSKEVVGLNEKLSATYESLTFLQRCKKNGLVPNCVDNCIIVSLGIESCSSLEKLLNRTKKGLLNLLIRSKYSDIRKIRSRIKDLEERLSEHQEKLEPIIKLAKYTVQKDSKRTAISKFNRLHCAHKNSLPKNDRTTSNTAQTASAAADRVTIIGDIEVSPTALQALEKGPGFVIAPRISREQLQYTVQNRDCGSSIRHAMAFCYNSPSTRSNQTPITEASAPDSDSAGTSTAPKQTITPTTSSGDTSSSNKIKPATQPALSNLAKICSFHNTRSEPPRNNREVEKQIQRLQTDIQRLIERCDVQVRRNISLKEEQAVINLRNEEDRLITRSDKGGEMVVMNASHMDELCLDHLRDTTTYVKLNKDPTCCLLVQINKTWRTF